MTSTDDSDSDWSTYEAIREHNLDALAGIMNAGGDSESTWSDLAEAVVAASVDSPANTTDYLRLFRDPKLPEWMAYREILSPIKRLWGAHLYQSESEATDINPENLYLVGCLISGCARRGKLTFGPDLVGEVAEGIQHPSEFGPYRNSKFHEIKAVGACITILGSGSKIFGDETFQDYIYTRGEFRDAIDRLNAIRDPIGLRFFEAVKRLKDSEWEPAFSSREIWELFYESPGV